jgi:mRNA-degrading endonuclease RelE of RelBE toxin-antitoxin system
MAKVEIIAEAQSQFAELPSPIQRRVRDVLARLTSWPEVSGAKPLRRELKGCFRIRVGAWRVLFRPIGPVVSVFRIDNRRDVYDG